MSTTLFFRRFAQQCSPTVRFINLLSTRLSSSSTSESSASIDPQDKKKIDEFIQSNKIAIFIKGEPTAPRKILNVIRRENSIGLFRMWFLECCPANIESSWL